MWILAVTGLGSLLSAVHLWRRRSGGIARKLVWTGVVALPAIGPLLYFGMYRPLRQLGPAERATERDVVADSLGANH